MQPGFLWFLAVSPSIRGHAASAPINHSYIGVFHLGHGRHHRATIAPPPGHRMPPPDAMPPGHQMPILIYGEKTPRPNHHQIGPPPGHQIGPPNRGAESCNVAQLTPPNRPKCCQCRNNINFFQIIFWRFSAGFRLFPAFFQNFFHFGGLLVQGSTAITSITGGEQPTGTGNQPAQAYAALRGAVGTSGDKGVKRTYPARFKGTARQKT